MRAMNVNPVYKGRSRMTKLRDKQNVIRYTLTLLDFDGDRFLVKVKEYGDELFPKELIRQEYDDLEMAEKAYHKLIDDYSAIIILDDKSALTAEEIFDHSVGYHLCSPKCCSSCKFSVRKFGRMNMFGFKYVCLNESNIRSFNRLLEENRRRDETAHSFSVVHPEVSPIGLCKNYKRMDERLDSRFNLYLSEFHDDPDWELFKERNCGRKEMVEKDFVMDDLDVVVK